jgi:hypothetical protein
LRVELNFSGSNAAVDGLFTQHNVDVGSVAQANAVSQL